MTRPRRRRLALVLANLVLALGVLTMVPLAPAAAAPTLPGCSRAGVDDKCEAWVATYADVTNPSAIEVSPDGTRVFVSGEDVVAAFDASSGALLWDAPFPADDDGALMAIAVSPDGATVYATGLDQAVVPNQGFVNRHITAAFSAASGAPRWRVGSGGDHIEVSPSGAKLYVARSACPDDFHSFASGCDEYYEAKALGAATGATLWTATHDTGLRGEDYPFATTLSPDGNRLFVTGQGATVGFSADTGATLWSAFENQTTYWSIAASPDSSLVLATGQTCQPDGSEPCNVYATVAHDAASGAPVWVARLAGQTGPSGPDDTLAWFGSRSLAVGPGPGGDRAYVTGSAGYNTDDPLADLDYDGLVLAYDLESGAELWQTRFSGDQAGTEENGWFVEASPDGAGVFVAGRAFSTGLDGPAGARDFATLAYDAASGSLRWAARYNSAPDGADTDVPVAGLALARDGTRLFVAGTFDATHSHLLTSTTVRSWGMVAYDTGPSPSPAPRAWSEAGALAAARAAHTATRLDDGQVLVAGGCRPEATTPCQAHTSTAELYDPARRAWSPSATMTAPRAAHTATRLDGGAVLLAGGCVTPTDFVSCTGSPTAERYDPAPGVFAAVGPMAEGRFLHAAAPLADGSVLVAGGLSGSSVLAGAEVYDPDAAGFRTTGAMSSARASFTATPLVDGRVLVVAGEGAGGAPLASAEIYDPATGSFTATGPLAVARRAHTATRLGDGRVLVAGGCAVAQGPGDCAVTASAELYDPATAAFTQLGSLAAPRATHTATLLSDGTVLVAGGRTASGTRIASAEVYDPERRTFAMTDTMLEARGGTAFNPAGPTATLLADGSVLAVGGSASMRTEVYSPSTVPSADLSLTMSDEPDPVLAGGDITYRLDVGNAGPDAAAGVTLRDTLPSGTTVQSFSSGQGTCEVAEAALTCLIGQVTAGASASVNVTVRTSGAGTVSNTATVQAMTIDPDEGDNQVTATTTVRPAADLAASIVASPDPVKVGSQLSYHATVSNRGPSPASAVKLTMTLPSSLTFQAASSSQGSCGYTKATRLVACAIGPLPDGQGATVRITVKPTSAGTVSASATFAADEADPDPGSNTATATTTVTKR